MMGVDEYYLSQLDRLTGGDDVYDRATEYLEDNLDEYCVSISELYADPAHDETAWEVMFGWAMYNTERAYELLSSKDVDYLITCVLDEHFNSTDDYEDREAYED
jgi:hypothetical protein